MRRVRRVVGQHLRQGIGHVGRCQGREGVAGPLAFAKPLIALRLVAQRIEQCQLVSDRECRHVAVEHHTQRVQRNQARAVTHVVHGQPGQQAAQGFDDTAVRALHQCQDATQRQ